MTDARFPDRWLSDRRLQRLSDGHFRAFITSLAWSVTNRAEGGIVEGPIVIQIHGGNRWVPAGFWRWRNIGIRELP